jgi:hypothetical protein
MALLPVRLYKTRSRHPGRISLTDNDKILYRANSQKTDDIALIAGYLIFRFINILLFWQ